MSSKCTVDGCDKPVKARGYCGLHYHRWERHGGPLKTVRADYGGGAHSHPLYGCYYAMRARCYNPNNEDYEYYGGRGIKVCDRWLERNGFWNFVEDMGERPTGYSLDRIDPNQDYSPTNCRWANVYTQRKNQRRVKNDREFGVTSPKVRYANGQRKYITTLKVNGKTVLQKTFARKEAAIKARQEAEREWGVSYV